MKCYKCSQMVVLHAFSKGKCMICKNELITPHIPANKLCSQCATVHKELCECCGQEIIEFTEEQIIKEIYNETGIRLIHRNTGIIVEYDKMKQTELYENCDVETLRGWNEKRAKSLLYNKLYDNLIK